MCTCSTGVVASGSTPTVAAETGSRRAPTQFPFGTLTPANKRKYGVDSFGVRAQVDF